MRKAEGNQIKKATQSSLNNDLQGGKTPAVKPLPFPLPFPRYRLAHTAHFKAPRSSHKPAHLAIHRIRSHQRSTSPNATSSPQEESDEPRNEHFQPYLNITKAFFIPLTLFEKILITPRNTCFSLTTITISRQLVIQHSAPKPCHCIVLMETIEFPREMSARFSIS